MPRYERPARKPENENCGRPLVGRKILDRLSEEPFRIAKDYRPVAPSQEPAQVRSEMRPRPTLQMKHLRLRRNADVMKPRNVRDLALAINPRTLKKEREIHDGESLFSER